MFSVWSFCALFAVSYAASLLEKPPHVVLMLGDDLGWNDVGWHDPHVQTPVMNGLIASGVELNQNYVQPQCTPSRAALFTGLYPYHQGMQHGVIYPTQQECVPLSATLLPESLKELGYDTHLLGKWHLGFCDVACTPPERGFDTFYGFYQGCNGHFDRLYGIGANVGYDWRNGTELISDLEGVHDTDLLLARAIEIVKNHDTDAPLFMNLMWGAPHQPFVSVEEWAALYPDEDDEEYQHYLGMISHLDWAIGKLVQSMKDAGLYDNTIFIFMADNGGEAPIGKSMPHRGAKGSLFEGGIHSASWFHSALATKTGYKNEEMIHVTDWYPTLVSLAGGSTEGLDGLDVSDALLNGGPSPRTEFVVNIDNEEPLAQGHRAIRWNQWKLIDGYPGEVDGYGDDVQKTWKRCHWDMEEGWTGEDRKRATSYAVDPAQLALEEKCITESMGEKRLFNVIEDPEERYNVAADNPDIVADLTAKLDKYEESIVDIPHANTLKIDAGYPKNYDGIWEVGWCEGVPQANDPIVLHNEGGK